MADTKTAAGTETKAPAAPSAPAEILHGAPVDAESGGFSKAGYVVQRPGVAEASPPSFLMDGGEAGYSWTWDRSQATVFDKKDEASALIADKTEKRAAGPAAGENAKVIKASV